MIQSCIDAKIITIDFNCMTTSIFAKAFSTSSCSSSSSFFFVITKTSCSRKKSNIISLRVSRRCSKFMFRRCILDVHVTLNWLEGVIVIYFSSYQTSRKWQLQMHSECKVFFRCLRQSLMTILPQLDSCHSLLNLRLSQ